MKAIIYCRVSSEKQVKEGHGLDGQEKRCKDFAISNGHNVVKIFKEEGVSGGVIDRPEMQRLLDYLDEHKEEEHLVVIDDIKRLARDIQGHFTLKTAICSRNAQLGSPSHRFEDTPEGKFIETILAGAGELERSQNARQVKNRMKARLESGYWTFRSPPTGLKYENEELHGKILRCEPLLTDIYKEAIENYEKRILITIEDVRQFILRKYKEKGLDKKLSLNGTKDILTQILYTGYFEYLKWGIPLQKGKHDSFISLETYENVQKIMLGRTKIQPRKDYNADFPLRPYVLCATCKKPLSAAWCGGRPKRYAKYWCRNKQCIYYSKTIPRDKIMEEFAPFLQSVAVSREVADLSKEIFLKTWRDEKSKENSYRLDIEKQKRALKEKVQNLIERVGLVKDNVLVSAYEGQIRELTLQIESIEQVDIEKNYSEKEFQTAMDQVVNVLKEPVRMWQSKDYENKTTILQMYFEQKLTYDLKSGFQTAGLAFPIKLINGIAEQKNDLVEMGGVEPPSEETLIQRFS